MFWLKCETVKLYVYQLSFNRWRGPLAHASLLLIALFKIFLLVPGRPKSNVDGPQQVFGYRWPIDGPMLFDYLTTQ